MICNNDPFISDHKGIKRQGKIKNARYPTLEELGGILRAQSRKGMKLTLGDSADTSPG